MVRKKDKSKNMSLSTLLRGFTMVELLIVISIIGILSGVLFAVIQPGSMRANARDAQRLSDLRVVQGALEMYFADNRRYPLSTSAGGWILLTGSDALSTALTPYLSKMKSDPINTRTEVTPCGASTTYGYNYRSNGSYYYLSAIMENSANSVNHCRDVFNIAASGYVFPTNYTASCATNSSNVCVAVKNP